MIEINEQIRVLYVADFQYFIFLVTLTNFVLLCENILMLSIMPNLVIFCIIVRKAYITFG